MVILGILLVLIAVALGAALIAGTSTPGVAGQTVDISFFDTVTISVDPLTLVVAGMVAMFLLWLGLVLIKTTLTRKARARKQRKEQETAARQRQVQREHERPTAQRADDPVLAEETTRIPRDRDRAGATPPPQPGGDDPNATRPIRPGEQAAPPPSRNEDATRPVGGDDAGVTRPIRKDDDPKGDGGPRT